MRVALRTDAIASLTAVRPRAACIASATARSTASSGSVGTGNSLIRRLRPIHSRAWRSAAARKSAFDHGIDEAEPRRLGGLHAPARGDEPNGGGEPGETGEALGATRPRNDAQSYFRQSDHRIRRCDAGIAAERELKSAAQRGAGNGGNDGLFARFNGGNDGRQLRVARRLSEFANVGAGDEGLAGADENDGSNRPVTGERPNRCEKSGAHRERAGIDRRIIDDHKGDVRLALDAYRLIGNGVRHVLSVPEPVARIERSETRRSSQ